MGNLAPSWMYLHQLDVSAAVGVGSGDGGRAAAASLSPRKPFEGS